MAIFNIIGIIIIIIILIFNTKTTYKVDSIGEVMYEINNDPISIFTVKWKVTKTLFNFSKNSIVKDKLAFYSLEDAKDYIEYAIKPSKYEYLVHLTEPILANKVYLKDNNTYLVDIIEQFNYNVKIGYYKSLCHYDKIKDFIQIIEYIDTKDLKL